MSHFHLVEYRPLLIPIQDISESEVNFLYHNHGEKIAIEWPSPRTGGKYQLTSLGWVGHIPLGEGRGIYIESKVPLANVFEMLEYAYDLKSFHILAGEFDCRSVQDYFERIAVLLAEGVLNRSRIGLYRSYQEEIASLAFVRGRIEILEFARTPVKTNLVCTYEDQNIDNEENRILAWTLHCLVRSGLCSSRTIPKIRKANQVLQHSVSLVAYAPSDCVNRTYNRLNSDYEKLHHLCRFILEKVGPTHSQGDRGMLPFLVNMGRLFESFVFKWFLANIDADYILRSQEPFSVGPGRGLNVKMDLVVYSRESGESICVLDTKYKGAPTVAPDDYYQVVAYADALGCENAFLVYPFSLPTPFDAKPGRVRVRSVSFETGVDLEIAGKSFLQNIFGMGQISSRGPLGGN